MERKRLGVPGRPQLLTTAPTSTLSQPTECRTTKPAAPPMTNVAGVVSGAIGVRYQLGEHVQRGGEQQQTRWERFSISGCCRRTSASRRLCGQPGEIQQNPGGVERRTVYPVLDQPTDPQRDYRPLIVDVGRDRPEAQRGGWWVDRHGLPGRFDGGHAAPRSRVRRPVVCGAKGFTPGRCRPCSRRGRNPSVGWWHPMQCSRSGGWLRIFAVQYMSMIFTLPLP